MVIYSAALELPYVLVEWVTRLVVTCVGDRRCKLRPSQRAMVALREHTTLARTADSDRRRSNHQKAGPRGRSMATGLRKSVGK